MCIDPPDIYRALETTWPPARVICQGPWKLRSGLGGGSRVSATTLHGRFSEADIGQAEEAMNGLGQDLLFMIRGGDDPLAQALLRRGYRIKDPVAIYASSTASLSAPCPDVRVQWPPAQATREIWRAGGIDEARIAVMDRAACPKASLVMDCRGQSACCAYVAVADDLAMVHAVETLSAFRRMGLARQLMAHAACWSRQRGAERMALIVRNDNHAANMLYRSLGMAVAGSYFYCKRARQER